MPPTTQAGYVRTVTAGAQRAGAIAIAAGASLWGGWGVVLAAAALPGAQSAFLALATIGLAGAPLLPRRLLRDRGAWLALGAIGVCDAANIVLYFEAVRRGPVGVAVLSHYLAPVLVTVASPLLLRSVPRPATLIALGASLLGLGLMLGDEALSLEGATTTAALGAGSAVFFATSLIVSKRFGDRLAPAELLVYHVWISALLLAPLAAAHPLPPLHGAALVVAGGIVCGTVGGMLFLWGLARVPAAHASVLTYLEPAVGVTLSALVLGERLPTTGPAGVVLVLAAGVIAVRRGEPHSTRGAR